MLAIYILINIMCIISSFHYIIPDLFTQLMTLEMIMSDEQMQTDMDLNSGISAFEAKHFSTASRLLSPYAEQGNAEAQFRMAIMYQNGLGMVKNDHQALRYKHEAAMQRHALAQHGLGFKYLQGECADKDQAKAVEWLTKAAEQGMQGSMTTLAIMYKEGNGVELDIEEANRLFMMAGFNPEDFS